MTSKKNYIQAKVIFKKENEGGRCCMPVETGYSPHLATKVNEMLGVYFIDIKPDAQFGEPFNVKIGLLYHPKVDYSNLSLGTEFKIIEGPKIVGTGTVTKGIHTYTT